MEDIPLLSILIPTRNREEFTLKVIHHILGINDDRFQLIIQDNSDTNKIENLLPPFLKDSRIQYFYNNEVLSFVENFSQGLSKCTGIYVTIIGDDDGINPRIIDIVSWANMSGVEAISPSLPVVYCWPQSGVISDEDNGRLRISDITCGAKFYNPKKEVIKLLRNGCQDYLSFNLAKVYHGIIKRTVLEEIRSRTGIYIGGLSPDIYLSIAASLLVEKVLIIDYPLTISGICKKSGSSDSATGRHTGELQQAPHFRGHLKYRWSDKVPAFYSVETIWADSALAAISDLKFDNLVKYFRVDVLSAYCLKGYPEFKESILKNLAKNYQIPANSISANFHLFIGFATKSLKILSKKIIYKLLKNKPGKIFNDVADIEKASEIVQAKIKNSDGILFERIQKLN